MNNVRKRRSIRLPAYDYSQSGYYFVTLCTFNRKYLLGKIDGGEMILSRSGVIVSKFWELVSRYDENIVLDRFIVMPNHIHGIIQIKVGAIHELPLQSRRQMLLPKIIGKFKMTSAKKINNLLSRGGNPFWQRNYYEHIIRSYESLDKIREYVDKNIANWQTDKNNLINIKK